MTTELMWTLEDHDLPSFLREEPCRMPIDSEEMLTSELQRLTLVEPRVIFLRRADGVQLDVGIGGDWMYVRLYRPEVGRLPFIYLPKRCDALSSVSYSSEGQPHVVDPDFLICSASALDIIQDIYRTGATPPGFVSEYEERLRRVSEKTPHSPH